MRFAHARPATVTLVAGSVLITATSGLSLAAVMGETPAWAHPSGYAVALDDAAATASNQSCEPVKADDPAAHRVAHATPTPTATGTTAGGSTTPTATPTATQDRLVHHADYPAAGPLHHAVRPTGLDAV